MMWPRNSTVSEGMRAEPSPRGAAAPIRANRELFAGYYWSAEVEKNAVNGLVALAVERFSARPIS